MQFVITLLLSGLLLISPPEKSIVIVELFTSEGCSSCPPADQLLSDIVNKEDSDVEVIGLSFHVDYWDYIGWKDPYADQRYTQRQRSYARKFYSNQIYTPQMVVNGKYEFVGSNRTKWREVLKEVKTTTANYAIKIEEVKQSGNELQVRVTSGSKMEVKLNVAIVERGLSQNVTRGENRGRKLSHDNVVRSFTARQFDGQENQFKLKIPSDLNKKNSSLIVYAQLQDTWEVIGAEKVSLTSY